MKIVSFGDMVTDFYYKNNKLLGVNGGMTSHNIIVNLCSIGYDTKVIGVCGNDDMGSIAIKSLQDLGVDVSDIFRKDIDTRCFHVSYFECDGKLDFTSKKRCPICNNKKWYDISEIDIEFAKDKISTDDIIVIDNLNLVNYKFINMFSTDIMLDLGQYLEFEDKSNDEILTLLSNKFCIIQMNERVEKYLLKRLGVKTLNKLYEIINPKLLVVTRGKNGVDFSFDKQTINKKVSKIVKEVDSTGAGDAFFACIIDSYLKNNKLIDKNMLEQAFENASKMTIKVIKEMGARGHLNKLYKTKQIKNYCTCEKFEISNRKKIKRVNININSLEKRTINALKNDSDQKLIKIIDNLTGTSLFVGTGGSFAAAYFASRIVSEMKGITTIPIFPREILYRNNADVDKMFLFSYSGTTSDLITSTKGISRENVIIISKNDSKKAAEKANIPIDNVVSYNNGLCAGKERGFLSFEGVLAPSVIFLSLILGNETEEFVKSQIVYWDNYFDDYFNKNRKMLRILLSKDNILSIFKGDFTNTAALDLESKIIESGIYNLNIHEKKNFSHGRFINIENQKNDCYIYLKQSETSKYEEELLKYLNKEKTILIQSNYNGLKAEFDLLVASQYFMYYISSLLDIDISKPEYSDESMKIYSYKGEL